MGGEKKQVVLERGGPDRLLPRDFGEIMTRRFLPVLSLTYISAIIGIATEKGRIVHYLFHDKTAYIMALLVAAWVSVPAVIWIFLHENPLTTGAANMWYKIIAGLMILTLMVSFILFPEADVYGLRIYFACTMPIFLIMYLFFVRGGLPAAAAHPLTAMGITALIYGAILNYLH